MNFQFEYTQRLLSSVWPDWRITRKLGTGTYGQVYEILRDDLGIEYKCALKILQVETDTPDSPYENDIADSAISVGQNAATLNHDEYILEDFVTEVSSEIDLMMQLKGLPHIISIEDYAVVRNDGIRTILIRMEELESIENRIQRLGSLKTDEILQLGIDICSALSICEKKSILHRDIKPSNIYYNEDAGYKLGDFGISRTMDSIQEKRSMSVAGSPPFMAPEVFHGRNYNNTVDIYSLGLTLYTFLNKGFPPFFEDGLRKPDLASRHQANMRRLNGEAIPLPKNADPKLGNVICKACSPEPAKRYQTAEEFRKALMACRDTPTPPPNKKFPYPIVSLGIICLIAVSVFVINKNPSEYHNNDSFEENAASPVSSQDNHQPDLSDEGGSPEAEAGSTQENLQDADRTDVIAWSDKNLEKAVLEYLDLQDSISVEEAAKVAILLLDSKDISNIDSLRYFTGLRKLSLSHNLIADISPLAEMKDLQDLNLESNSIIEIDALSGLTELRRLDLYQNRVENLSPLSQHTKITNLDLRENQISDISPLSNMTAMDKIYLSDNADIENISALSGMNNLSYCSLRNNRLVSDLTPLTSKSVLSTLIIAGTNVSDISITLDLPRLAYLDVRGCPLKDDDILKRLKEKGGIHIEQ